MTSESSALRKTIHKALSECQDGTVTVLSSLLAKVLELSGCGDRMALIVTFGPEYLLGEH